MKIVVTGSLGNISRPLAQTLLSHGHQVTVISSKSDRRQEIESLGARAAIGSLGDGQFVGEVFSGADAVYTMVPPGADYSDPDFDHVAYVGMVGKHYQNAIIKAGIKRVVNLSSWGAHLSSGTGPIVGTHVVEQLLNGLPADVMITHIRPTSFYYNLYGFMPMIKHAGMIAANYGGDDITTLVSPLDIAAAVAEELESAAGERRVRYVASDEMSCNEVARILGEAIGVPDLKWIRVSDEDARKGMEAAGLPLTLVALLVELQGALHSGLLAEDFYRHRPVFGRVKMADFAKEFAVVYNLK